MLTIVVQNAIKTQVDQVVAKLPLCTHDRKLTK